MRVAMQAGFDPLVGQGLALWAVQIALNTLWTPVFFGLKRMGAGLVVVLLLFLPGSYSTSAAWRAVQRLLRPGLRNVRKNTRGGGVDDRHVAVQVERHAQRHTRCSGTHAR